MNRKIRPFHDLDQLTASELARVHYCLANSGYEKTRELLRQQFNIQISYGRIRRYYLRFLETQEIKKHVGVDLTVKEYIQIQNGDSIDYAPITQQLVQKAACLMAASTEDRTPAELLTLQRIANADFQQKLAREKLELEKRRLALREQELALKRESAKSTQSTSSDPENLANKPFRMWTAEEVRTNQPKIEAAFQAHPVLRYIGLPPVDLPATPEGGEDAEHAGQNPPRWGEPGPENQAPDKPTPAPTELDQLLTEARANPEAPFDPRFLKYVRPVPTSAHLSRDLTLPLAHRVTCYAFARQVEEDRGKNSDLVGLWAARNFKSKLNWCPCGHDLPCPDHPPMSEEFFQSQSIFLDYLAFCGLPYHGLGDLIDRLKRMEEQTEPKKSNP